MTQKGKNEKLDVREYVRTNVHNLTGATLVGLALIMGLLATDSYDKDQENLTQKTQKENPLAVHTTFLLTAGSIVALSGGASMLKKR